MQRRGALELREARCPVKRRIHARNGFLPLRKVRRELAVDFHLDKMNTELHQKYEEKSRQKAYAYVFSCADGTRTL